MSKRADQSNFDIPMFQVSMNPLIGEILSPVLLSGKISQYVKVDEFENRLKDYLNVNYALTVNSGTSGLHLVYHMLYDPISELNYPGFNENDIVLTTPLTCVATNFPILLNKMNIQWVDIDENTLNMNLVDLKNKLSERTKIISLVHWGGTPIDLDELKKILDYAESRFGFRPIVVEDCAHSFGAEYNNKKLGSHGNIVMYSFQAIKHLTTIDGGLLVLPTKELYERAKLLRWFGISRERKNKQKDFRVEDNIVECGFKFHMNDVNASVGIANLELTIKNIEKHRSNAMFFDTNLKHMKSISLLKHNSKSNSSYWIYSFRIKSKRNEFIEFMREKGICVSQIHGRNDKHSCLDKFVCELPVLDRIEQEIICIPVGWWLSTNDLNKIVLSIKQWDESFI